MDAAVMNEFAYEERRKAAITPIKKEKGLKQ
jgi:hypothetical protein